VRAAWLAVVVVVLTGCTSESRVPCASQATCEPLGALCVDGVCRKPEEVDLAGVDMSAEADLGALCAGPADCLDPAQPICDPASHQCRGCVAADCSGSKPVCATSGTAAGSCVQCLVESDCKGRSACNQQVRECIACVSNGNCDTGYCAFGECARPDDIAHVDGSRTACAVQDGSLTNPYCTIAAALASGKLVLVIAPKTGSYDAINLPSTGAEWRYIVGPAIPPGDKGYIDVAGASALKVNVPPGETARVVVSGMLLTGGIQNGAPTAPAGIECAAAAGSIAQVVVSDGRLTAHDGSGVGATNCDITVKREIVLNAKRFGIEQDQGKLSIQQADFITNQGGAIKIEAATYSIENTLFRGFGVTTANPTIYLGTAATGVFRHSGLYYNDAGTSPNITCAGSNKVISATLFVGNTGSMLFNGCTLDDVITPGGAGGGTAGDPQIDASTYKLVAGNAKNQACCIDKRTSGPSVDLDGMARPKGGGWDIGPHEVE
jgi:hypothetical protein